MFISCCFLLHQRITVMIRFGGRPYDVWWRGGIFWIKYPASRILVQNNSLCLYQITNKHLLKGKMVLEPLSYKCLPRVLFFFQWVPLNLWKWYLRHWHRIEWSARIMKNEQLVKCNLIMFSFQVALKFVKKNSVSEYKKVSECHDNIININNNNNNNNNCLFSVQFRKISSYSKSVHFFKLERSASLYFSSTKDLSF